MIVSWYKLLTLLVLLVSVSCINHDRWSRQLGQNTLQNNHGFSATAINDWIPLTQPCPTCRPSDLARESSGRVLNHNPKPVSNSIQTGPQMFNNPLPQPQALQQPAPYTFVSEPFPQQPPRFLLPGAPQIPQAQHLIHTQPQNIQQMPEAFQLHQRFNVPQPQHISMRMPFHQMINLQRPHHLEVRHPPTPLNFPHQQFIQHQQPPPQAQPQIQFIQEQQIPPFVHLPPPPPPPGQSIQQHPEQIHYVQLPPKPNQFNEVPFKQQQSNVVQHHTEVVNRPQTQELVQQKPTKPTVQPKEEKLVYESHQKFNFKQQPPYQVFQEESSSQQHHHNQSPPKQLNHVQLQQQQQQQQQHQQPQEEVQLVYVPLETLYQHQKQNTGPNTFNLAEPVNPGFINTLYDHNRKPSHYQTRFPAQQHSTTTSTTPRTTSIRTTTTPRAPISVTQRAEHFRTSTTTTTTTPKPKPKTHQPPLAMFMQKVRGHISEKDVVSSLDGANTIDVIDTPSKLMPKIFIGPWGLDTPEGYSKFDLPY